MRSAVFTVALLLLAGALVLTVWQSGGPLSVKQVPPGQYPLHDENRAIWPKRLRKAPFRPAKGMGSDRVRFRDLMDAKASCALTKPCAL